MNPPRSAPEPAPPQDPRFLANPADYKIGALFFRRLASLIRPYWFRRGAASAWAALALGLVWIALEGYTALYFSELTRDSTNALAEKNAAVFWKLLWLTTGITLVGVFINVMIDLTGVWLNNNWRSWLTKLLVDDYLQGRNYYRIEADGKIDNPDQRIQEGVAPFCNSMIQLPQELLRALTSMGVQTAIVISLVPSLIATVLIFSALKIVVTLLVYKPFIRQSFEVTLAEADLRYGLLHVRTSAETIAFYGGEATERAGIFSRLTTAVGKSLRQDRYLVGVIMPLQKCWGVAWGVLPMLVLLPLYMRGDLDLGQLTQATIASGMLMSAIDVVYNFIPSLAYAAPHAVRLAQIQEQAQGARQHSAENSAAPRIELIPAEAICFRHLNLETPAGEQRLVRDLTFDIGPTDSVIVVGPTGVGKSSLLRAMAGLWWRGSGTIGMPSRSEVLFLPQKPYMVLSDLRTQLAYPKSSTDRTDAELQSVLERVNLPSLAKQHGGFKVVKDWGRILSLGEQQRLAFARVLIAHPRYAILDESTSAVDVKTERLLYDLLREAGIGFVSVGHRPTLTEFHTKVLRLAGDGSWRIESNARSVEAGPTCAAVTALEAEPGRQACA